MTPAQKFLRLTAIGCGIPLALGFIALAVIGTLGPETSIYEGADVPERFVDTLTELGLLEEGERIRYMYSDSLLHLEEGVYLLTDRNLSLYVESWDPPELILPLETITSFEVEFVDGFLLDSTAHVEALDGSSATFPLSSEFDRDHAFAEALLASAPLLAP